MTRHSFLQSILLLIAVTTTSCQGAKPVDHGDRETRSLDIARIRAEMIPLNPGANAYTPPAAIARYFHFYDLDPGDGLHLFGTFPVQDKTIAGHIFVPAQAKGTIFLLHGYYDHSGIMARLITFCLEQGLAVALFDLPGHGLSGGPTFAINDFSDYAAVLTAFVNLCQDHLPKPLHLIAHSLGCAIAYEYLHGGNQASFTKVIFLAPLIHSRPWQPSKAIYFLCRPFTNTLPRIHRHNSSAPEFIAFSKNDPLQQQMVVPMTFLGALYSWEKRAQGYDVLNQPLLIIQGNADVIVDWRYNVRFLTGKFTEAHTQLIAGANHQLANESPALRADLFRHLKSYLDQ
ncbi:MAG: alpha/beta hydrolase [Proteobacteria bacterium]|nr:alpha/beta hydrolase [Pseudomonadota bacterium]MBU1639650.1 alpha/beta hydrolase [Pseudomonadota bacterium]